MNKDFHLYGTYTAAKLAGVEEKDARVIACAAQMVDDFTEKVSGNYAFATARDLNWKTYLPIYKDIKKATDNPSEESEVLIFENSLPWILFHFIPGYLSKLSNVDASKISEKEALLCGLDGPIQKALTEEVYKGGRSEVISNYVGLGITMHILSDVYAHSGFSGLITNAPVIPDKILVYDFNDNVKDYNPTIMNKFKKFLPDGIFYGHAKAGHLPDISTAKVEYCYKDGQSLLKDNRSLFATAFGEIIAYVHRYNGVVQKVEDDFADKWFRIVNKYLVDLSQNKDAFWFFDNKYEEKYDDSFRKLQDILLKAKNIDKIPLELSETEIDFTDLEQITEGMISADELDKVYDNYKKLFDDKDGDQYNEFFEASQLIKCHEVKYIKNPYTGEDIDLEAINKRNYGERK